MLPQESLPKPGDSRRARWRPPSGPTLVAASLVAGAVASLLLPRREQSPAPAEQPASHIQPLWTSPGGVAPRRESARHLTFPDDMEVLGVSASGEDRAYLLDTMESTENHVVNDLFGEAPVSVTYCDRTRCARAFTGGESGRPLALRPTGYSAESGMVLDSGQGEYFQNTGQPVSAGAAPFPYREAPSARTTLGEWKAAHPDTAVVFFPCLASRAWAGDQPGGAVSIPPGERVAGVTINGLHRAYVLRAFDRPVNFVISDALDDVQLTVAHSARDHHTSAFVPTRPAVPPITFAGWDPRGGGMILEAGGRLYDAGTGAPRDAGEPRPFPFREVALVEATWGEWKAAHPDTSVYVGQLRELVRLPRVAVEPTGLNAVARLLPFAPAAALLLALVARRAVRKR